MGLVGEFGNSFVRLLSTIGIERFNANGTSIVIVFATVLILQFIIKRDTPTEHPLKENESWKKSTISAATCSSQPGAG